MQLSRSSLRPAFVLGAAGVAAAQGVDTKINNDSPGTVQNEVALASPGIYGNSSNMVAAFNDRVGPLPPTPIGVATTTNGGALWVDQQLSVPPDPFVMGGFLDVIFDPNVAWGPPNEFYVVYIATINAGCAQSGVFIERSDNGGMNWSGPQALALDPAQAFPGDPNYRFNDRCHVDTSPNAFVCVTWIKDVVCNQPTSDVYFTYGGPVVGPINQPPFPPTNINPFSVPVIVNDNSGIDMGHAPHVANHPNGSVYVAWADYNVQLADAATGTIEIDRTSIPTGLPVFGVDRLVANIDPVPRFVSSSLGVYDDTRGDTYPVIAVDENDGSGNTVFLAYAADPPGVDEGDIYFVKSTDGGMTWSVPLRVNDDLTTRDQIHPAIVDVPAFGPLWIAWYDKRNAPFDNAWDVYVARSTDRGATFSASVRVSDATYAPPTSTGGARWLGEYLGLQSDGRDAFLAFTKSTTDALGDVFYDRVQGCQFPIFNYCTAGLTTNGCMATMSSAGTPSATAGAGFTLMASNVEGQKLGLIFYGFSARTAAPWGASSSFLCMKAPTQRTPAMSSGGANGACNGALAIDWNLYIATNPGALGNPLSGGEIVRAQAWFRDPPAPKTTNLSDALEFAVCP